MIRVLVLIAISGFLAGVVALAGAAALGGPDLAARHWDWAVDWDDHRGGIHRDGDWRPTEKKKDETGETSREIAWDGSTKAIFELPADIEFTQAAGPGKVTIAGPRDLVSRVRLNQGRLSLDGEPVPYTRLRVVVSAPSVTHFEVGGDDHLEIRDYKQDKLTLVVSGSAEVAAKGEARDLDLELSGSGEADLADLAVEAATADVSGSGEATLAPRERASLEVSGSGEVRLATRPTHLDTDIAGAGEVTLQDGSPAKDTGATRKPTARSQET